MLTGIGSMLVVATLLLGWRSMRAALQQLREMEKDRHLAWVAHINERWDSDSLEEARLLAQKSDADELARKVDRWLNNEVGDADKEWMTLRRVPSFFEEIAVMVDSGALDVALVWEAISGPALKHWEQWEPSVQRARQTDPFAWTQFEALIQAFHEYELQLESPPAEVHYRGGVAGRLAAHSLQRTARSLSRAGQNLERRDPVPSMVATNGDGPSETPSRGGPHRRT